MKKYILLIISLILISCNNSDDSNEFTGLNFDQNTFENNRQLWAKNEILNYTFTQEYFSNTTGSQPLITCKVKDYLLESVTISPNYNENIDLEQMTYYETIDDVFNYIEWSINYYKEQIDSSNNKMTGAKINVEYDETFNFPTKLELTGYYSEQILGGLSITIFFNGFEKF